MTAGTSLHRYSRDADAVDKRRLRNACLGYLGRLADGPAQELALAQFRTAGCMTDSVAAVAALASTEGAARDEALAAFYERAAANNEPLVVNKWLSVQAMAETPDALANVKRLLSHPGYDASNPNSVRALVSTFAMANHAAFHAADGSGYDFAAEQVIDLDARNPQIAARLATAFNSWKRFDEGRQQLMKAALERIAAAPGLSKDTMEIATRSLA
jgi:aminopeptidase N